MNYNILWARVWWGLKNQRNMFFHLHVEVEVEINIVVVVVHVQTCFYLLVVRVLVSKRSTV